MVNEIGSYIIDNFIRSHFVFDPNEKTSLHDAQRRFIWYVSQYGINPMVTAKQVAERIIEVLGAGSIEGNHLVGVKMVCMN